MCFQQGAYLEDEYEQVFKSLFEEKSFHQKIMDALSKDNKKGITRDEILQALNISSGGKFSDALDELMQSGFVLKYDAYRNNKKKHFIAFMMNIVYSTYNLWFPLKGQSGRKYFRNQLISHGVIMHLKPSV